MIITDILHSTQTDSSLCLLVVNVFDCFMSACEHICFKSGCSLLSIWKKESVFICV